MPKLSIVIPAYNEEPTIHHILDKVKTVNLIGGFEKEVVIVDDCSKDGTFARLEEYKNDNKDFDIQLYKHEVNRGKELLYTRV